MNLFIHQNGLLPLFQCLSQMVQFVFVETVNTVADCDKYPVPKTEDIFATLNGGEKFAKLNLSQAYQQLLWSPKSRELLTVNTHKGYFNLHVYSLGFTQLEGNSRGNLKID